MGEGRGSTLVHLLVVVLSLVAFGFAIAAERRRSTVSIFFDFHLQGLHCFSLLMQWGFFSFPLWSVSQTINCLFSSPSGVVFFSQWGSCFLVVRWDLFTIIEILCLLKCSFSFWGSCWFCNWILCLICVSSGITYIAGCENVAFLSDGLFCPVYFFDE